MPLSLRRSLLVGMTSGALALGALAPASSAPAVSAAATSAPAPVTSAPVAAAAGAEARHVVFISVDGLRSRVIRKLGPEQLPTYHRMIRQGATTLNARTAVEKTATLPNHTGMLTGRPVKGRYGHGVTFNHDNGGTVHAVSPARYVSSVFDVVHDRGGSTSMYSEKPKFRFYARTWRAKGGPDRVGVDNGRSKIDRYVQASDAKVTRQVRNRLKSNPDTFTFLHLAAPALTGHKHGFSSGRYRAAIKQTDRLVGSVLDTIARDPNLRARTTVVLSSDHGGVGRTHYGVAKRANYTVPFMVWGRDVAEGTNLYSLNPDRRRPGSKRIGTYKGKQPIRHQEVANLVTDLLGLPSVPGSRLNRNQTLDVS